MKNVLAAGGCELRTRGNRYELSAPHVVHDPTRRRFPIPVRVVLKMTNTAQEPNSSVDTPSRIGNNGGLTMAAMTPAEASDTAFKEDGCFFVHKLGKILFHLPVCRSVSRDNSRTHCVGAISLSGLLKGTDDLRVGGKPGVVRRT